MDAVIASWTEAAAKHLPAIVNADRSTFFRESEALLHSVIYAMRADQSGLTPRNGVDDRLLDSERIFDTARQHAADRLRAGFTIDELVSEYRGLRATVGRLWLANVEASGELSLAHQIVHFDAKLDQSLTEAVKWFNSQVEQARDLFVGVLGHDLRDPLNAAHAAIALHAVCSDDPDQQREALTIATRSLEQMTTMIDTLLDYTRTRLGRPLPIDPVEVDLNRVCTEVVKSMKLSAPGRQINLEGSVDVRGLWDESRIRRALWNLVSNALDYGDPGTAVTVNVDLDAGADEVVLSVHNRGDPIPAELQSTMFDPLIRGAIKGSNNDSASRRGLGLGLYIVDRIARAHGGDVRLSSDHATGTTFAIHLPLVPPAVAANPEAAAPQSRAVLDERVTRRR